MNNPTTLYDCLSVLQQLDELSEANGGELPVEATQMIVLAHTTSIDKLSKLTGFIKHCEAEALTCKNEIDRIQARKKSFENKLESVKKFLLPYVQQEKKRTGHNVTVGTVTLGTRKSQSVDVVADFCHPLYCNKVIIYKPDKKKIKEFLKNNPKMGITGVSLVDKINLSMK